MHCHQASEYTMASIINVRRSARATLAWRLTGFLFLSLMAATAAAQPAEPSRQPFTTFERATADYADMHRRLEQQIGPIELGTPLTEINRIIRELNAAIRAERRDAGLGDFFTPVLAPLLRARIADALHEHGFTADDVRASARVDGAYYDRAPLRVNDTFPWILAVAMFPCVIDALPPLPPELQYRIVGDDLVLIDIHASLVVDILPRALADLTAGPQDQEGWQR
jgi:hypothetical protein